jgi:hypothetical protein
MNDSGGGAAMDLLKLTALDEEDLKVVSAHMQDAVARIGDMRYLKRAGTFALIANRFVWATAAGEEGPALRRRTGLRISRVRKVRVRRIRQGAPDAVVSLLALTYRPGSGGGEDAIELTFSGGGTIRLDVECIEVQLRDLGEEWPAAGLPRHDLEGAEG